MSHTERHRSQTERRTAEQAHKSQQSRESCRHYKKNGRTGAERSHFSDQAIFWIRKQDSENLSVLFRVSGRNFSNLFDLDFRGTGDKNPVTILWWKNRNDKMKEREEQILRNKLARKIEKTFRILHCSHWYWHKDNPLETGSFSRGVIVCNNCGKKKLIEQLKDHEILVEPYRVPDWIGKRCEDCGNEKCKKLGMLPKGYDCALWQKESEE